MAFSYGISAIPYSEIIIFDDEADFKKIVSANPQMTAIIGADGYTQKCFPGVFVAGVKKSQPKDK